MYVPPSRGDGGINTSPNTDPPPPAYAQDACQRNAEHVPVWMENNGTVVSVHSEGAGAGGNEIHVGNGIPSHSLPSSTTSPSIATPPPAVIHSPGNSVAPPVTSDWGSPPAYTG